MMPCAKCGERLWGTMFPVVVGRCLKYRHFANTIGASYVEGTKFTFQYVKHDHVLLCHSCISKIRRGCVLGCSPLILFALGLSAIPVRLVLLKELDAVMGIGGALMLLIMVAIVLYACVIRDYTNPDRFTQAFVVKHYRGDEHCVAFSPKKWASMDESELS